MGFGTSLLLSNGPQGTGTTWQVASSGFVNPSYLGGDFATTGLYASDGFQIEQGAMVVVAFEGTYAGAVLTHQQTFDQAGVTGWFSVSGSALDGSSAGTGASTSGVAYAFVAAGVRHRIQVTALASGTLVARASLQSDPNAILAASTPAPLGPSGVTPIIAALTSAISTATFTPNAGRGFNVSTWGTFVASFQLERSFDSGANWLPITAAGTQLYQWTAPESEQAEEDEYGVQYRVHVTSYTSGTLNIRLSQ